MRSESWILKQLHSCRFFFLFVLNRGTEQQLSRWHQTPNLNKTNRRARAASRHFITFSFFNACDDDDDFHAHECRSPLDSGWFLTRFAPFWALEGVASPNLAGSHGTRALVALLAAAEEDGGGGQLGGKEGWWWGRLHLWWI